MKKVTLALILLTTTVGFAQNSNENGRDGSVTPETVSETVEESVNADLLQMQINHAHGTWPLDLDALIDVPSTRDQVILDDLIVDGSACIGMDCVNGESFGFDALRLKENNIRIKFDDTSNSASFPNNDWQITINGSGNGDGNYFAIDDITNARTPFLVEATAPTDALRIDDNGNLGIGTGTPVVEIHNRDGDTPTLRLEQDGSNGFGTQTWDMAGNETNFFVRDVTNGSTLPFRIRPGAPSSAIDIAAGGNVGIGTASPSARLDVDGDVNIKIGEPYRIAEAAILRVDSAFTSVFVGDSAGAATTGANNTFVGAESGFSNTTGGNNVSVGYQAHYNGTDASNATVVGANANGGANSTAIGYQATATGDNSMALGNNASSTANNEIVLGNSAIVSIGGIVNWTATSDMRFKTNVQDNVTGLDFIDRLKPVTYNMDIVAFEKFHGAEITDEIRAAAIEKGKIRYSGFLAQEVAKAAEDVNYDFSGVDAPNYEGDSYGIRYAEFVIPLVKATQELSELVRKQQEVIDQQKNEMASQKSEIGELKAMFQQLDTKVEGIAAQSDVAESK